MKKMLILTILVLLIPFIVMAQKVDNTPVTRLNLKSYLGDWYEIARFDHSFERGMEDVRAMYTLNDDGTVQVCNTGWKDGKFRQTKGKAFVPDPVGNPGLLRVSFFGPFYSDYRVLMIDRDYEYALVGSKSGKYLWILSRMPSVPDGTMASILTEAERRGYDTEDLIWVHQKDANSEW